MRVMKVIVFTYLLINTSLVWASEPGQLERNKALVVEFYEMAFVQHRGVEAAERYLSKDYIQHNPYTKTGRQAFIDYVSSFSREHAGASSNIKRVIAEGDLVVLHVHDKLDDADRGNAIVDIFRVENNKIVEHWDVIQKIPDADLSGNTMF